jgi:hypothetical protein
MGKIDTSKDFTKYVGSLRAAKKLILKVMASAGLIPHLGIYTTRVASKGTRIFGAYGECEKFSWKYDGDSKTVSVEYTDGLEKHKEESNHKYFVVESHPEYYVVWIEGLEPKTGEKIHKLLPEHNYTTSMTKAMRVLPEHRELVKDILRERGIAEWALNKCFVKTNYAPKGTLFKPL